MGQPSERVPIGCMGGGEGPNETVAGKPSLNVRIIYHIILVVKIDKLMVRHLPENSESHCYEDQVYKGFAAQDERLIFDNIHMLSGA